MRLARQRGQNERRTSALFDQAARTGKILVSSNATGPPAPLKGTADAKGSVPRSASIGRVRRYQLPPFVKEWDILLDPFGRATLARTT